MKLTGTQVTVMVVAVSAATILAPAAVSAATTGSSVNITDPVYSSARARVGAGKLFVGDGAGALTVDGTVSATVTGAVTAADPATTWSLLSDIADTGTSTKLAEVPATGHGISIGTLVLSHTGGTGSATLQLRAIVPTTPGDCSAGAVLTDLMSFTLAQGEQKTVTYSPGFRVGNVAQGTARDVCLNAFVVYTGQGVQGAQVVNVTATGYTY
jgi:hypothetical protein